MKFEPVEPLEKLPSRYSQTLLRHFDRCRRSAYLYLKHGGGSPAHEKDRGTAFHLFMERAAKLLIEEGETTIPYDVGRVLLQEVMREHPELTVPAAEQDRLREMAYHVSEGMVFDPSRIVAVERKFAMGLDRDEPQVVGKLDYAELSPDGTEAWIFDWKTSYRMASEDELTAKLPGQGRRAAKAAQLVIYALLFLYGRPVQENTCEACGGHGAQMPSDPEQRWECPTCEGRGYMEELLPPLGERVQIVHLAELYPQYLFDDGIGRRNATLTRAEAPDHLAWLETLVAHVDSALGSWDFPAVDGSHCAECPARAECPIPPGLKDYRGRVNTPDEAAEMAAWHEHTKAELGAVWKELKGFADYHGPIRYGADLVLEYDEQTRRKTDFEGLEEAVERAAEFGEPFDLRDFVKPSTSTVFRRRKLTPEELASDGLEEEEAGERWGAEAPF